MIDQRIPPDDREAITTGEAIAGMILNGLGFSDRPMSLTPQFFANKPLEVLFRAGVEAGHFNRFKLGRSLDDGYGYGCDRLFSELSWSVCQQEGVDLRFGCLDTTSFSVYGAYVPETDEQAILVTHGYSKDHRPDLKQAILELMVSQDGGVPFFSQSWDGNASDNEIFQERAHALIDQLKHSPTPRYVVADSKLYTQDNGSNLALMPFITRIPETLKDAQLAIEQAWDAGDWKPIDEGYAYHRIDLCHYGIEQRWLVVYSKAAEQRAQRQVTKLQNKEHKKLNKQLFHLQAQRFESQDAARAALKKIQKTMKYHGIGRVELTQHIHYACQGRPTPNTAVKAIDWQIQATLTPHASKIQARRRRKACFVVGTSIPSKEVPDEEVIGAYKGQSAVERGFRFLKDPVFFVSSLFVKKPCRVQGLLMVMTLALLIYSVAQRRMRTQLEKHNQTLPNQIGQPTSTPTLRWIFQLLDGIHRVRLYVEGHLRIIIEGLTDLRKKILRLFGQSVCQLYQISCP
jgi:transposase